MSSALHPWRFFSVLLSEETNFSANSRLKVLSSAELFVGTSITSVRLVCSSFFVCLLEKILYHLLSCAIFFWEGFVDSVKSHVSNFSTPATDFGCFFSSGSGLVGVSRQLNFIKRSSLDKAEQEERKAWRHKIRGLKYATHTGCINFILQQAYNYKYARKIKLIF